MTAAPYTVVVPTVGRPSLADLLRSLDTSDGPAPAEVILVDDRRDPTGELELPAVSVPVRIVIGGGSGPAAARNRGWRAATTEWVAFLDDDVVVDPGWRRELAEDLAALPPTAAGSQGVIAVPVPKGRRPTDWERNIKGLEAAWWATADLAYRCDVLEEVGGFDERFPRAFREDSDLALRIQRAGYLVLRGQRRVTHPVRPADRWVSVRLQAGNADDVLMRALHGPDWRVLSGAAPGRTGRHLATLAGAVAACTGAVARRRSWLAVGAGVWAAGTGELAWTRMAPGPRTPREVADMVVTSAVLPVTASIHWLAGWARLPRALGDTARAPHGQARNPLAVPYPTLRSRRRYGALPRLLEADPRWEPRAILFDRDGTLVVDVPHNGDPDRVVLMPGARVAVARARRAGLGVGVVSNQSGVARGLLTPQQVDAVNRRIDALAGPFDVWEVCPHGPEDACGCRKPAPGLVKQAADALGVDVGGCAVIGDIAADAGAAHAAGARAVVVPTRATTPGEIGPDVQVAPDLLTAVDLVLGGRC